MKDICEIAEEAIWDRVREGIDLPEQVAKHIESCQSCARAAKLVPGAARILRAAGQAPEIADAAEVMRRIHRTESWFRPGWTFGIAAAVVILAMLGVTIMIRQPIKREPAKTNIVEIPKAPKKVVCPALVVTPKPEISAPDVLRKSPKAVALSIPKPNLTVKNQTRRELPAPRARHRPRQAEGRQQATDAANNPKVVANPADNRVLAAVSITWTSEADPEQITYYYSDTDSESGITTRGALSRSGDSIVIRLESGVKEEQPKTKGEIYNETFPNA
ncbi:MAG: hypothetical protein Q7N50_05670 [Armatimonadota bacterium]|nr:hypothetical protein [Armatimonadota bacterium]